MIHRLFKLYNKAPDSSTTLLIFVEIKVDSEGGDGQLQ